MSSEARPVRQSKNGQMRLGPGKDAGHGTKVERRKLRSEKGELISAKRCIDSKIGARRWGVELADSVRKTENGAVLRMAGGLLRGGGGRVG